MPRRKEGRGEKEGGGVGPPSRHTDVKELTGIRSIMVAAILIPVYEFIFVLFWEFLFLDVPKRYTEIHPNPSALSLLLLDGLVTAW